MARVAGVATVEAVEALCSFQREREFPTLSKALGAALEEWSATRAKRVGRLGRVAEDQSAEPAAEGVLHPPNAQGEAFPSVVRILGLKEFARARLPPEHPLRDALLAEPDVLTPEQFLAKLEVWCVLVSRKA